MGKEKQEKKLFNSIIYTQNPGLLKIKCQKFNNFFVIYILLCHPFLEAVKHYLFLPEWRRRVMDNKVLEQKTHWLIYTVNGGAFFAAKIQRDKENKEVIRQEKRPKRFSKEERRLKELFTL